MSRNTRKRESLPTSSGAGPVSATHAASWTAPTPDEFTVLKRYKSFLLPPNTSYYVGEFVWLAHEGSQPYDYTPEPTAKKARRSSYNSQSAADGGDGIDESDASDSLERSQTDARWKAGLWLGKIVEIRARDTSYVWMKIRWMCRTVRELREQNIKSGLPKGKVGGREIFQLGPEFDALQPVGAVEAHASVILFDEGNPMAEPIHERDIFFRSEANTVTAAEAELLGISAKAAKGTKRKSLPSSEPVGHLFPYTRPSCYCEGGYLPLSDPSEPMAMCANQGCGKWYHLGCLDWRLTHRRQPTDSYLEYVRTSGLHLLSLLPKNRSERDESASIPPPAPIDFKGKTLAEMDLKSHSNGDKKEEPSPTDELPAIDPATLAANLKLDESLPPKIRQAAISPIIRGDKLTGIVGNARKIIAAREIVDLNRRVRLAHTPKSASKSKVKKDAGANDPMAEMPDRLDTAIKAWEAVYGSDPVGEPRSVVWLCPGCRGAM